MDLFKEVIPSLFQTKESVITPENEKEYAPYVVNKALSFHMDCILYTNEMNLYPFLDKKMQYDFYLHSLMKKKRQYQKWQKSSVSADLETVKEYFGYSSEKAKDALRILSEENLQYMRDKLHKGGVSK